MNVANVMSVTAWPRRKNKWNDDNDIADLTLAQVEWEIKQGCFPVKELDKTDKYIAGYYGGTVLLSWCVR